MSIAEKVAQHLLKIKAVKLQPNDPFTWASGMRSPIYCDNRIALSYPEVRNDIRMGFVEMAAQIAAIDVVAGVATAGIAHGALLADALELPYIYVRSKPKTHGRQNLIEGEVRPGANVLVVEDLISTGGSSIAAVEALRAAEMQVQSVFAIFDYGFAKAKDNFDQAHCSYATLSNYPALLKAAVEMEYISAKDKEVLQAWNSNPDSWYETYLAR